MAKANAVRFASTPSPKLCTGVAIRNVDKNSLAFVDAVKVRPTHRVKKYKGEPLATVQRTWDSIHTTLADNLGNSGVYTYVDVAHTRAYQAKRLKEADAAAPAAPAAAPAAAGNAAAPAAPAAEGNAANEERARAAAAWVATAAKNDNDLFWATTAAQTEPEEKEDDDADLEDDTAAVATKRLKTGNGSKQADESDDESDDDYDPAT